MKRLTQIDRILYISCTESGDGRGSREKLIYIQRGARLEPVHDLEFLSQAVYPHRHEYSILTTDVWLDQLLIHQYGTSLKARRDHLRFVHNIHRLGPIVMDERTNFVLFPLTSSAHRNAFWLNLRTILRFSTPENDRYETRIHFSDGTFKDVAYDRNTCEKQYQKTLTVLDRMVKIREYPELYFNMNMSES